MIVTIFDTRGEILSSLVGGEGEAIPKGFSITNVCGR
jgi:hypothetical protein